MIHRNQFRVRYIETYREAWEKGDRSVDLCSFHLDARVATVSSDLLKSPVPEGTELHLTYRYSSITISFEYFIYDIHFLNIPISASFPRTFYRVFAQDSQQVLSSLAVSIKFLRLSSMHLMRLLS